MPEVIATATADHTTMQVIHRGTEKFKFFVQITARHQTKNMYLDLSKYSTGQIKTELTFPVDRDAIVSWGTPKEHGWWLKVQEDDAHVQILLQPTGSHNERYHEVELTVSKHLLS